VKLRAVTPGLIGVASALGASACCVLPLTVALLGLGSGAFMLWTMPYRPLLYPLGLLGVGASWVLYLRERRRCDALACRMAGGHVNLVMNLVATALLAVVTYVDFFLTSL